MQSIQSEFLGVLILKTCLIIGQWFDLRHTRINSYDEGPNLGSKFCHLWKKYLLIFILCVWMLSLNVCMMYVCVPRVCLVPAEARRWHWIPTWGFQKRILPSLQPLSSAVLMLSLPTLTAKTKFSGCEKQGHREDQRSFTLSLLGSLEFPDCNSQLRNQLAMNPIHTLVSEYIYGICYWKQKIYKSYCMEANACS